MTHAKAYKKGRDIRLCQNVSFFIALNFAYLYICPLTINGTVNLEIPQFGRVYIVDHI